MDGAKRGTGHIKDGHRTVSSSDSTGFPAIFTWPLRVYFEDTDAGGVVYHANYLRFMERARTEWLRALGHEQDELRARFGIQFVVISAQVDFRRAARFNTELEVSVNVTEVGRASLYFDQQIRSLDNPEIAYCDARIRVACVDVNTFKPRPLPKEIVVELTK